MRVRHFGNTANNAFHNLLLLEKYAGVHSEYPIRMFGLEHAISAPAWEGVEFEVPSAEWIAEPDWAPFPSAAAVNGDYADLTEPVTDPDTVAASNAAPVAGIVTSLRSRVFGPLRGKRWAQPAVDLRDRWMLAKRPMLSETGGAINIVYGSASLLDAQVPKSTVRTVSFEHGTLRWMADGSRDDGVFRSAYRDQLQQSAHLWVTNLDPRTLEIAEDVVPGRWSALPHPFTPDARVPFAESPRRAKMLRLTSSERLVLLPSSQNSARDHDKGSGRALRAFVELRRSGLEVGLVAVAWGRQVAEAKEYLRTEGVDAHVTWVLPQARFSLQRLIADVDVVWDQFGLDAFGALALRVVEQGTPLVSRGLAPVGEQVMGGPVPWLTAASTEEIVQRTSQVLADMDHRGRDVVIAETRARYRGWLFERHSPALTAELQRDLYQLLLNGGPNAAVVPDEWARRLVTDLPNSGSSR